MQNIQFLQIPRWVPFKKYRAKHLEETCNHPNLCTLKLKALVVCTKTDGPCGVDTFRFNFMLFKMSWEFGIRSGKCTCKLNKLWQLPSFITTLWAGVNYKFTHLVDFKIYVSVYHAIKQEKIFYTTGTVKTDPHKFVILNSCVKVTYLRFIKNT